IDADSPNFEGGYLRVGFFSGGTWTDRLGIVADSRVTIKTGDLGLVKQIKVDGKDIGWAVGGSYGVDLVIVFNKNATPDRVETLLEHIGYANSSTNPVTLPRTVNFTLVDGDGIVNGGTDTAIATAKITFDSTNVAPSIGGDYAATIMEGGRYVLTRSDLTFTDPDDAPSGVTFSVSNVVNGTLKVNGVAATSFTGQQLLDGLVTFEHNGSETTAASFRVSVEDGNEDGSAPRPVTFNFTVTPVNDAPTLSGDLSAAVARGGAYTLTTADLNWSDVDDNASGVTFSISHQVHGTLRVNGVAATSFTGQQLLDGLVTFQHNGSPSGNASFRVSVEDGNEDGSAPTPATFNFTISGGNAPPVLTGDLSATLAEGGVYTLTLTDLGWSDADDSASGVMFTVSNLVNGTLRVNGVAAPSFTGEQLQNGLVTFEHNGSETTTASFQVLVEDGNEDGSAPVLGTFNFSVTPVNDPPFIACDLMGDVAEGGRYTITPDDLWFVDPDDGAAEVTFTAFNFLNGTTMVNGVAATSFTGQQLQSG
ncbi:MAG: cadherin-like domain-containing protein, partial [Gammaproteobacteria bacterium]